MNTYGITQFDKDVVRGKAGEKIFIEDFLEFLNITYVDVTSSQGFRIIDNDFVSKIGMYEVKLNYRDDKNIIIEEYTNYNESLGKKSYGWFYKSQTDMFVFISKATRTMILLPFTDKFKEYYESIKDNFPLKLNRISISGNNKWQSAFRVIPLSLINGYFAYYKKIIS